MDNSQPFIRAIEIHHVRHLVDLRIDINAERPRHLILTGPNGCGKTSVLRAIRNYLEGVQNGDLTRIGSLTWDDAAPGDLGTRLILLGLGVRQQNYRAIPLNIAQVAELEAAHARGEFLIAYFPARRGAQIDHVDGARKLELPTVSPIDADDSQAPGRKFLQFLVNQKNRSALLMMKGDLVGVEEIEAWMANLTAKFRELFGNPALTLEYDIDNFEFKIAMPGREPFRLLGDELSDGFSAVIEIIVELLLRMEAVRPGRYDVPGIVLIDEIETHLHIQLQKAVLPFLTGFFPNIQFIVTTHSPFVLTSLPDSVVFDLESHKRWEHLAPLSASTVIEEYFDADLYSSESKRMIERYETLAQTANRNADEEAEWQRLRDELDVLDYDRAPELVAHYRKLRAKEKQA